MTRPAPVYFTAAEAAAVLHIKPWEVSKLCKDGHIKASKPGLKWLISPDALNAYITRNDQDAA